MKQITTALAVLTAVSMSNVYAQSSAPDTDARTSTGQLVERFELVPDADANRAVAVGMGFTYQGTLNDGGAPANGAFDLQFTLTDEVGTVIAGPICMDNVLVVEGLFTVELDFGASFTGDARELSIAVRPGGALGDCGSGGYTVLSPRQKLTATPYALGLRFPFEGIQSVAGNAFTVRNPSTDPAAMGIRGVLGDVGFFPFIDQAGVRGESNFWPGAGVIGISDRYVGVIGYSNGDLGVGTYGRADGAGGVGLQGYTIGPNGRAVFGNALGFDSWGGYFQGRLYADGPVGIGTTTPTAALDVVGTTKTDGFMMPTGAGGGLVLTSDASGNGTWQNPSGSGTSGYYNSGPGTNPTAATQFLSTTVTVTVAAGQQLFVTANQTFGSNASGGAFSLDLFIGYRVAGSGSTPTTVGGGMFDIAVPHQWARMPFGVSAVISGLPAGTYEVGMAGDDDGNGNWNNNEWGYVSVLILH